MKVTKNLYTDAVKPAILPVVVKSEPKLADLTWEMAAHLEVRNFPDGAKATLGYHLYLAQKGETPPNSNKVPGIAGAFELRDQDAAAWYRVICIKTASGGIHVLHCFEKQSNQIEKRDMRTIQTRLGNFNRRLAEERRNAKE